MNLEGHIDLSARTKLKLTGGDRERYLNGQVTNNVSRADSQSAIYACVTNAKGKLESDVFITATDEGDAFLIDGPIELGDELMLRLDRYIIADDAELTDVTDDFQLYHAFGPENGRVSNRVGVPGRDFWVPQGESAPDQLGDALDEDLIEQTRIAHGFASWGTELTPDFLPQEANVQDRAIDFHKGCYIGQEVISRIKSVGRVNKQLAALVGDENSALSPGMELLAGETTVGTLTSCAKSADLGKWIALGYVKRGHLDPGTQLNARSAENNLSYPLEIRETPLT